MATNLGYSKARSGGLSVRFCFLLFYSVYRNGLLFNKCKYKFLIEIAVLGELISQLFFLNSSGFEA